MNDNPIIIPDDEINVEEIMKKIQNNIPYRENAAELSQDLNNPRPVQDFIKTDQEVSESIQHDLTCINTKWNIHNNTYLISSHRPFVGKMLVKGRQIVHGEVRRYIDPVISRQTEFNASTVRLVNQTYQKCAEWDSKIFHQREELTQKFSELKVVFDQKFTQQNEEFNQKFSLQDTQLNQKLSQQDEEVTRRFSQQDEVLSKKLSQQDEVLTRRFSQQDEVLSKKLSQQDEEVTRRFSQQDEEFDRKFSCQNDIVNTKIRDCIHSNFHEVFSQVDKDLQLRMGLIHIVEERMQNRLTQKMPAQESMQPADTNYFLFEERFRGTREDIRERQLKFLPYFKNCSRVLDIGCGRGEFLEILRDHNISGIGIDLDADMVTFCKSQQLEVEQSDAITCLEKLADKSLDGIFMDQVVEHLEPAYIIRLLTLCHQKLKYGYNIVIETVNPLSFVSFVNFYLDLTHKRPIHPETLQFLMYSAGFRDIETMYSSHVEEERRLKTIEMTDDLNGAERKNIGIYNQNVAILNNTLFGPQDYAVIGKK